MLQFLSIFLLLSIKCFYFKTTGPSSKRHLHTHRYTTQIKSYLVQWLHILLNHSALRSQGLVSVIPWTEEEIAYLSNTYCVQKHIEGERAGESTVPCQIICNLGGFYHFGFWFPATTKTCYTAITYEISCKLFEYIHPPKKKADALQLSLSIIPFSQHYRYGHSATQTSIPLGPNFS